MLPINPAFKKGIYVGNHLIHMYKKDLYQVDLRTTQPRLLPSRTSYQTQWPPIYQSQY